MCRLLAFTYQICSPRKTIILLTLALKLYRTNVKMSTAERFGKGVMFALAQNRSIHIHGRYKSVII